jgi:hypothetical protein
VKNPKKQDDRTAKVAALQAEQARRERRRLLLVVAAVAVVILAIIGATTAVILGARTERAAVEAAADQPIPDVKESTGLSANHVQTTADPSSLPPLGGDHDPVWQNCGIYDEPVPTANAVHSLEHGAVWVIYHPDLPPGEVTALRDLVEGENYALLSPYPDGHTPVRPTESRTLSSAAQLGTDSRGSSMF